MTDVDVGLTLLTPIEARALRAEAESVLRSVRRWRLCECEASWRGVDNHCGRCGKRRTHEAVVRALLVHIEALDEVAA